ncbi:MAG TPA: hypothetical protein VKA68_12495 [bacterium]|nr:hypothetical protein [bacterium]
MNQELYMDFRDVFRIPRVALSGKKIWTLFIANIIGYIGFMVLSYVGIVVSGYALGDALARYHFFPFPYDISLTVPGWIIYSMGSLVWIIAYYFANLAVARITYKEFKGDFFYSSGDGWSFVKKHWHPLIFAPVSLLGIIAFFLIMAVITALMGKIPYVGEFIFSLPFLLYFPVAVFVLYSAAVFLVVITFTPAIIASSEEDTLEAVFQGYSLLWSQPWRIVIYEGIWAVLIAAAVYIFGLVMSAGVSFIGLVFGQPWLMGDKLFRMFEAALFYLGGESSVYYQFLDLFTTPFITSGYLFTGLTELNVTEAIASGFLAVGFFVIIFLILAYTTTLDSVGQQIIYLILRKKKDDENLLERKDEEELAQEEEAEEEEGELEEEFEPEDEEDGPENETDRNSEPEKED